MPMLVEHYGGVWKVSKRNYRKLLTDAKAKKDWDLDALGTYIGQIDLVVTDMTPEQAAEKLEGLK